MCPAIKPRSAVPSLLAMQRRGARIERRSDIVDERPAESDIGDLHAAANAQGPKLDRIRALGKHGDLECIANRIDLRGKAAGAAVAARLDVTAAR